MAKYKMTGCARFFLFLIVLGPIAYFGSKYLLDNGHLDNLKDKIEQTDSSKTIDTSPEPISANPSNEELVRLQNRFDELRKGYLEQEATIKDQAATIAQQRQEIENLKNNASGSTQGSINNPPTTSGTNVPASTGSSSLDELLREADEKLGTSPSTTTSTSGARQTLGSWQFSFSGVQGNIEFYQDRGKLFSKTTINGSGQMNVDELSRQGDRFTVIGSKTGEYYIVKSNGDLDAYDQGGYQTTCRRS